MIAFDSHLETALKRPSKGINELEGLFRRLKSERKKSTFREIIYNLLCIEREKYCNNF